MNRRQDKKKYDQETNKVTDLQGIPLFFPSDVLKVFPLKIIKKKFRGKLYRHRFLK